MNARSGNVSMRKAPGTKTLSACLIDCSADCRNLSSCDLMSKPYVISMTNAPVTLGKIGFSAAWVPRRSGSKGNSQLCVVKEITRGVSEKGEETISVFVLIIVEVRDGFRVEEFVKEPTPSPPLVSIWGPNNVPRVGTHS